MLTHKFLRLIKKVLVGQNSYSINGKDNVFENKGNVENLKLDIVGNNNLIVVKNGTYISNLFIYVRGNNHKLIIGENCYYTGGSVWFEDNDCSITIDNYTTIESAHIAAIEPFKSVIIGKHCMLSRGIEIRTGDGHSIIDIETSARINYAKNIEIFDHVWIGANVTILKGAKISENSIIGIGSIVTSTIPTNCIAAGIPAKVIKRNINWSQERTY